MVKVFPMSCWDFSDFFSFPPGGGETPFASAGAEGASLQTQHLGITPGSTLCLTGPASSVSRALMAHRDPQSSRNVLPPSPDLCLRTIVCQTFLLTSRVRVPCTVARELTWTGVHLSTSCSTWASCKGCGCFFVFSSAVVFQ